MAENRERLEKCAKIRAVHASETRVGESEKLTRWTGVYASSSLQVDAPAPSTEMSAQAVLQARCVAPGWTLPHMH
jgi:hypothetical protein